MKMNNDLISREALKKATKELYKETPDGIVKFGIEKVYDLIDNAPTVELTMGRMVNGVIVPVKKPQGEWYRTGQSFINPNKFRNYGCSICRYELDEHIREEPNFCPNCGAEMKGGAE